MSCCADVMKGSIAAMHALVYADVVQNTTDTAVSFKRSHNSSQHNSSPYTMHMLLLCPTSCILGGVVGSPRYKWCSCSRLVHIIT
jgi:hypothetical protein